jgi:hypothetical protein
MTAAAALGHPLCLLPSSALSPLAGEGWGGGWLWAHSFLGHPPPCPSPSRLRACPLPANLRVTKPRQAGVWLGEGTLWRESSHKERL